MVKFELGGVISPVRPSQLPIRREVTIFTFALTLTWHVTFKDFFTLLKSNHRELSIAVSPRPPVRELGRGQNLPPPPKRDAFGQIPQRGAG